MNRSPLEYRLRGHLAPPAWAPLRDALAALHDVAMEDAPRTPERHARARAAHTRLLEAPVHMREELPPALRSGAPEYTRWFVEAVLVWMRFTDMAAAEVLHTFPTTLTSFPVDLPASAAAHARLRRALREAFGLGEGALEAIERELDAGLSTLRLKQQSTAVLRRRLVRGGGPDATARHALMERFYGPVPFLPGEVDLVITSTFVFFCVPYEGESLRSPGWDTRSEAERERVRRFLRWLREGDSAKSDRFPAFGAFDRGRMDPTLAAELAEELGATPAESIHEQLARMAVVVPTGLADQYLIHDAYGHGWQGELCDFAADYNRLVHISDPLTATSGPYFGGAGALRLGDAFVVRGEATRLDEAALLRFAETDLGGRVAVALSSLTAEVLADVVEGKFIQLVYSEPERFPSSSLLPEEPLKLDLSITTLRDMVRWWRAPYLALREGPSEQARLVEELAALGRPREGLEEAVARAARCLTEHFASAFSDQLHAPQGGAGQGERVELFEWILLANASLSRELRPYLTAMLTEGGAERWTRPEACLDLIVLLLGWFYRRAGADTFFCLDALLRDALRPSLLRLRQALAET